MIDLPKNKKIILFDGICNLCNSAVAIVIKQDKKNTFLFAAIQSKKGKEIIDYLEIDIVKIDAIILYEPGVSYEVIKVTARTSNSLFLRALRAPGLWLQNITTQQPEDDMVEVAITALKEAFGDDYEKMIGKEYVAEAIG